MGAFSSAVFFVATGAAPSLACGLAIVDGNIVVAFGLPLRRCRGLGGRGVRCSGGGLLVSVAEGSALAAVVRGGSAANEWTFKHIFVGFLVGGGAAESIAIAAAYS